MIANPLEPLGGPAPKVWREEMTLPCYHILRIPEIPAGDPDFTIRIKYRFADSATDGRGLFVHNAFNNAATLYSRRASTNVTWMKRGDADGMLSKPPNTAINGILTYMSTKEALTVTSPVYGSLRLAGGIPAIGGVHTQNGKDMSCLIIGAYIGMVTHLFNGYLCDLYMEYLTIATRERTIEIGQDPAGRFYDKRTRRLVEMLDTRDITLIFESA